jgi:hypothetical protein
MSRTRLEAILLLALVAAVVPAMRASAQASDSCTLTQHAAINRPFNDQEKRAVSACIAHWVDALNAGDPERARMAKRRLLDPLRAPAVSPMFRDEYGRLLLRPALEPLLQSATDESACVNALQIVAALATDDALNFLRDRIDPSREQRLAVRLWAVNGVRMVALDRNTTATQRSFEACVREIGRAGDRESEWLVVMRHFEALAAIRSPLARDTQVELLRITLDRIAADPEGPSEFMQAVHKAAVLWMHQWVDRQLMPAAERAKLGKELAPELVRVWEIAMQHWESAADTEPRMRAAYDGAIRSSESVLRLLDSELRGRTPPPSSAADTSWGNGSRDRFEQNVRQWREVLRQPPYASR